jgi:DNA polymerase-3 subunit delta
MRATPETLPTILQKGIVPIYLLYGNEAFLIEESAHAIRHALRQFAPMEHAVVTVDHYVRDLPELLAPVLQSRSLFAQNNFIEIRIVSKLTAPIAQQLAAILENAPSHTYFLIQMGALNRTQQQAKWVEIAAQKGLVVAHSPLVAQLFAKWVQTRARSKGLVLQNQALDTLVYNTEGNCMAAAQEIERLVLYYLDQPNNTVITQLEQQSQFTVFDLQDSIQKQQPQRVLKILEHLRSSTHTPPTFILWALAQNARKQPLVNRETLLERLSATDLLIKSGEVDQCWQNIVEISFLLAKTPIFSQKSFVS